MLLQSPFRVLPLHIIERIVEYVIDSSRLKLDLIIRDHDYYEKLLISLVDTCLSFAPPILSRIFRVYAIQLTGTSNKVQNTKPSMMTSILYAGLPARMYVSELDISVDMLDVFSGAALKMLSSEFHIERMFPKARTIKFSFSLPEELEEAAGNVIASPDIESNISAFVQRIRLIAPMMKKTTISVVSLDFNRYPFPAQPSNDLIAQLSQYAIDIDYGFYFWPVAINQQLSGLRSLEHCSNDPTDSGRQAVQLARRNASTLQLLKIDVHGSIDITGLVQNDDGGYVQYPCLLTFKLYGLQGLDARRLPVFPGAVPFPNLRRLDIGYENPFGDDTVFRGNATTLEYLSLNTSPVTARILREHRVFTPVSHPNLQQVNIGVKSDFELNLLDTDVDHMRFILSIGATAPVRVIRDPLTGPGFQSVIPVFGEHACIQVLKLDNIRLSLWDVIALVKALPLLSDLHTSFSGIGQRPRGVAKHKLPAYVIANYASTGKRLRCWQFPLAPTDDVKHAVRCVLLLALVCPNFDYAAIHTNSELFMAYMKEMITTDGFRPHASRLRRLLFGGWRNKIRNVRAVLAAEKAARASRGW